MTMIAGAPVVAGVDGSNHQAGTIEYAATEARLRNRPLALIHAYDWAALGVSIAEPPYGSVQQALRARAEQIRNDALEYARQVAPDLEIHADVIDGGPARVLVDASQTAALVVVGRRGIGGFAGLLIGQVAGQVAAHAACPVIVVRGAVSRPQRDDAGAQRSEDEPSQQSQAESYRVVAGIDGSPHATAVLEFAFQEASLRGIGLTVVHAWTGPVPRGPGDMLPLVFDVNEVESEETRLVSELMAGWRDKYPDVDVRQQVVRERPAKALIRAAGGATLLVAGARGQGGFVGLRLGSVCRTALNHSPCPFAVIHSGTGKEPE